MKRQSVEMSIFKAIFQLSNRIQVEGDKLSKELTLKQWFLLLILYKGTIQNPTVNDISLAMGVTRQSTKKMISILEKGGYLTVDKSNYDSRALCIRPTDKAYDFFKNNKFLGYELLNKIFEGIEENELAMIFQVLQKMQDNLNEKAE
jgi:MarR family transcriptional regulator for hemolysin